MKRTVTFLYVVILAASLLAGCSSTVTAPQFDSESVAKKVVLSETSTTTDGQKMDDKVPIERPEIQITVLDVGQGLCVLMESSGEYILYDGGGKQHSSYVVSYLKHHGIEKLKYLFASHYDEDHIAGLIGVLRALLVNEVIVPNYQADTSIYESFMSAAEKAEKVTFAKAKNQYSFGDAAITILYAADGTEETENDKSTVVRATMGNFACIITGDAEYGTEEKLIQNNAPLSCDVYIVGHHGSSSSSSSNFVSAMSPETSIISVGVDNDYGHPTKKGHGELVLV